MAKAFRIALMVIVGLIAVQIVGALLIELVVTNKSAPSKAYVFAGPGPSFMTQLSESHVRAVVVDTESQTLQVTTSSGDDYMVAYPDTNEVLSLLRKHPSVQVTTKTKNNSWWSWPYLLLPIGLILSLCALSIVAVVTFRHPRASRAEQDELDQRIAGLRRRRKD